MKPKDKPNLFSGPDGYFETGYLSELGYMSSYIKVCAWLANIELNPEISTITNRVSPYPGVVQSYVDARCSVSIKTDSWDSVTYNVYENPSADPEHRFVYVKIAKSLSGVNKAIASLVWLKPIHETKFESILEPMGGRELALWKYTAPLLQNASVTEYALPAEAQVGPGKEILLNFVPEDMLPDWEAYRANFPTATSTPLVAEELKSLGYELRTNPNSFLKQLFRDNKVLFDEVYEISDIYRFSTGSGAITTFIVTTINKTGSSTFNSYLVQNDVVSEWGDNFHDPGFAPVLYRDEVLWLRASKEYGHIQVTKSNQDIVYSFTVYTDTIYSADWFGFWNGHWVLAARDFLIQDGENLNQKLDFHEIFNWRLIDNKPVYFFRKGPRIGLSYDGKILPLEYQEVAHHYCCGYAADNPKIVNDSAHFFGKRNGVWYYVVVKFK